MKLHSNTALFKSLNYQPLSRTSMWASIFANILGMCVLGCLLILMVNEPAHIILVLALTLSATFIAIVSGYDIWKNYSMSVKFATFTQVFEQKGVLLTDDKGSIVCCNSWFSGYGVTFPENAFHLPDTLFSHPEDAQKFHRLQSNVPLGQGGEILVSVVMQAPASEKTTQKIKIKAYPAQGECPYHFWYFEDASDPVPSTSLAPISPAILESSPVGIVVLNNDLKVESANAFFRDKLVQQKNIHHWDFLSFLDTDIHNDVSRKLHELLAGVSLSQPLELDFNTGKNLSVLAYVGLYKEPENPLQDTPRYLIIHCFDNQDQKQLHLQLMQAQKMQAMGQLAGGIAHDFNNLLTAMIGFCDLLLSRYSPGDQSFSDIMHIKQNANRAANLVRQLLTFSKQQTFQPQILNIPEALSELSILLKRLVGINIRISYQNQDPEILIRTDRGQLEQVIINLVVNARDAMNNEGDLTIRTFHKHCKVSETYKNQTLAPGTYAVLEIADTGTGISKEYMSRIFDPFFSTKEVGKGTGLGLSTVYGIVKQASGYIGLESYPGKGTTFSILFPAYKAEDKKRSLYRIRRKKNSHDLTGSARILFVEDEDAVRLFGTRALRDKGYHVVEARCGQDALEILSNPNEHFDLLITDIVMPTLDGPTLVKKITENHPNLKVIFISGYAQDTFRKKLQCDEENIQFLPKPFSLTELAIKVKDVLEDQGPWDE